MCQVKVAVTSIGEDPKSKVDPRFGRCSWLIVADTETGECRAVNNGQNLSAAQGAGIQAAENISRHHVEAVITGHCGPKAFKTMRAAGIRVFTGASCTVAEAVESFKKGEITEAMKADVDGHWA